MLFGHPRRDDLAFRPLTKFWHERRQNIVQRNCLLDRVDGRDKPGHDVEGALLIQT
jgi:hypothetical protein